MFYIEHDDLTPAAQYFNRVLLQRSDTCTSNLDFKIMYDQGLLNSYLNSFETSISYYNKALDIVEKNNKVRQKAAILNNLVINYLSINDSTKAIKYFYNSLMIRLQIKNSIGIAQIYNNLGMFYYKYKFYKQALRFFSLGYDIRKNIGAQITGIIELQINIGKVFFELRKYPQCEKIFNTALNKSKQLKHLEFERRVLEPFIEISKINKITKRHLITKIGIFLQKIVSMA